MSHHFGCDRCDYIAATREQLENHISAIHENNNEPYKCDKCDRQFITVEKLQLHKRHLHERH